MSKVTALIHIVFCTKRREMTITDNFKEDVYRFIWADVREHRSKLIRIGGIENHVHMLVDLHQDEKLSDFVRAIKSNSSGWLRKDKRFVKFDGWAKEYFATSVSPRDRDIVTKYICNQQKHHKSRDLGVELKDMYVEAGQTYDERDMI